MTDYGTQMDQLKNMGAPEISAATNNKPPPSGIPGQVEVLETTISNLLEQVRSLHDALAPIMTAHTMREERQPEEETASFMAGAISRCYAKANSVADILATTHASLDL